MAIIRFIVILIFAALVGVISYYAEELLSPNAPSFKKETLAYAVNEDLEKLRKSGEIPFGQDDLQRIYILDQRKAALQNIIPAIKHQFTQNKNGKYLLQIEIFSDNNAGKDSKPTTTLQTSSADQKEESLVIIQLSLFDAKTKNKIWELSRAYPESSN